MFATLLCLSMAAPPEANNRTADRTSPVSLDGRWTIVCLEKNGQPAPEAKELQVTIKDNTVTCSGKDGKEAMTWKIEFAKEGTISVKCTEADGANPATKAGVYVLTTEMLALCLHDKESPASATAGPNAKSGCTIILKRDGESRRNEK